MKIFPLSLALGALIILPGTVAAASASLSAFAPKVLPVLVQVDAQGKVTGASPAVELPPRLERLLRANLDEMISAPAIDKKGRPMSSQFIVNLTLRTSPRPDGDYEVNFAYLSTAPVPPGSWYWVHTDGRQLSLASQDSRNRREHIPNNANRYQPAYQRRNDWSSMPNISNIRSPAPAAAAPPAPTTTADPGKGH